MFTPQHPPQRRHRQRKAERGRAGDRVPAGFTQSPAGWTSESTRVCAFSFSTNGGVSWSRKRFHSQRHRHVRRRSGGGDRRRRHDVRSLPGVPQRRHDREHPDDDLDGQRRDLVGDPNHRAARPTSPGRAAASTEGDGVRVVAGQPGGHQALGWSRRSPGGRPQSLGNIIHGTGISVVEHGSRACPVQPGLQSQPAALPAQPQQRRHLGGDARSDPRHGDVLLQLQSAAASDRRFRPPIRRGVVVAITWASRMPGRSRRTTTCGCCTRSNGGDAWTQPIRVNDNTAALSPVRIVGRGRQLRPCPRRLDRLPQRRAE